MPHKDPEKHKRAMREQMRRRRERAKQANQAGDNLPPAAGYTSPAKATPIPGQSDKSNRKPANKKPAPASSRKPESCDICGCKDFYHIDGHGWFCAKGFPRESTLLNPSEAEHISIGKPLAKPPGDVKGSPERPPAPPAPSPGAASTVYSGPDKHPNATELFWQACNVPNAWANYRDKGGYPCANGLGQCCLPYVWGVNRPVKNCQYSIEYCIYFRRSNQAALI